LGLWHHNIFITGLYSFASNLTELWCCRFVGTSFIIQLIFSVSIGAVANCLPPSSSEISLLLADVRCFPGNLYLNIFLNCCLTLYLVPINLLMILSGMEGGLVLDRHASLVGMLIAPLRQKGTDTEIQVVRS
jgi:peroxisomal leader peptide-processing protease